MIWKLYSVICEFIGIFLFLYGFFWMNYDRAEKSLDFTKMKTEIPHRSFVKKVVLMVIDALRYDFVFENEHLQNMPYLNSLIRNNTSCVFPCRVHLPTVTMPRIKAITTGSISNFMDVALNFGTSQIKHDNILSHMRNHGMKVVFYGDDTWIRLFPNTFLRHGGIASFFVSDFYEVDNNVTRNVDKELTHSDWDVMILHYLGLDHIGHVEGPRSTRMFLKLREMDFNIEKIYNYLVKWEIDSGNRYIMVICSDHGMRDAGGHGGSSLPEVIVPFITIGLNCTPDGEIWQTDIAVTLSSLMGLPIPRESIGKLIPGLLTEIPASLKLDMYSRNTKHLIDKYERTLGPLNTAEIRPHELFAKAELSTVKDAEYMYLQLSDYLSSSLIASLTKFDVFLLYVAVIIVFQSAYQPLIRYSMEITSIIYPALLAGVISSMFYISSCESVVCNISDSVIVVYVIWLTISFNLVHLVTSLKTMVIKIKSSVRALRNDSTLTFLMFALFLQILSVLSTSFIEEEHMILYFMWTSWLVILFCYNYTKKLASSVVAILLMLHRVLQRLNQSGDKYSSLPDLGDWLSDPDKKLYLSGFLMFELVWILFTNRGSDLMEKIKDTSLVIRTLASTEKYLDIGCVFLVYLYRASLGEVFCFNVSIVDGVLIFRIYSYVLLAISVIKLMKLVVLHTVSTLSLTRVFIQLWILIAAILMRPYNVVLLGSLVMISSLLNNVVKLEPHYPIKLVISHHWLAQVYFFYQGNSNNLATIDITAGYAGQTEYNAVIIGSLIIVNTYAMPVLAYALLLKHIFVLLCQSGDKCIIKRNNVDIAVSIVMVLNTLHVAFYLIVVVIQRHHLFIWSVFCPKLLYMSAYFVVFCPFVIILLVSVRK